MPRIFGIKIEAPRLPTLNEVKSTVRQGVQQAQKMGTAAVNRAVNLGRQGADLGRRAVADPEGAVRAAAATARKGIRQAETAIKGGIEDGVKITARVIGKGADVARAAIPGNSSVAKAARNFITGTEQQARFTVGVVGGLSKEVVGLAGVVGTVGVSATELQWSPKARAELSKTIATGVSKGGLAVADYARAVAADPSRVTGDIKSAATATWNAGSGFVEGQVKKHEEAFRRGEGYETIGMTTGQVASYFIPVGAGAKAAATTVRGAEAIAVGGARVATREAGEAALRAAGAETRVVTLTASTAAKEAAEVTGARLIKGAEAGGGTVRVGRSGGVTAQDLAAASRQSGSEVALYRNLATNERFVAVGTRTGVEVPQGSRLIAHTQPGTGASAVRASVADEAALSRLGQRSSVIIDESGTAATRFRATEEGAALARTETGAVKVRSPEVGPVGDAAQTALPKGFASAEEFAQFGGELRSGLGKAGYADAEAIIQGSAVTGKSFKSGIPFDVGRVSDFDVALSGKSLFEAAKDAGIGLRSGKTRTGPLDERALAKLGLVDVASQMSRKAGRPVNFMIYNSVDDAIARAPSVILPK
jgi:hypothetical protein